MDRITLRIVIAAIGGVLLPAPEAVAQFHMPKSGQGQGGAPQSAQPVPQQGGSAAKVAPHIERVGEARPGMVLLDEVRDSLSPYNKVSLGEMAGRPVDIWGRAIHHSDGSYTLSAEDTRNNTLTQITKSKNGVELQQRMISLDAQGRPSEVMIYDARKQFKYRGVLVYDPANGRFTEEQIYDTKGTLIRRKVQEYGPRGEQLPVRSVDYVANVPEDLKLVITQRDDARSAAAPQAPQAPQAASPPKKGMPRLFKRKE